MPLIQKKISKARCHLCKQKLKRAPQAMVWCRVLISILHKLYGRWTGIVFKCDDDDDKDNDTDASMTIQSPSKHNKDVTFVPQCQQLYAYTISIKTQ